MPAKPKEHDGPTIQPIGFYADDETEVEKRSQ
jgi:hypothetical protein